MTTELKWNSVCAFFSYSPPLLLSPFLWLAPRFLFLRENTKINSRRFVFSERVSCPESVLTIYTQSLTGVPSIIICLSLSLEFLCSPNTLNLWFFKASTSFLFPIVSRESLQILKWYHPQAIKFGNFHANWIVL